VFPDGPMAKETHGKPLRSGRCLSFHASLSVGTQVLLTNKTNLDF